MRRCRCTKPTRLIAGLLTGLLFAILAVPLIAQPAHESHPFYDIRKEVTLKGTVSSVVDKPTEGMILGSHLMLETASGKLDASLGKWGLVGKGALSVTPGQQVEVTGVTKTIRDREVFIVRVVKTDGRVYTVRNEHGEPQLAQPRERASQKTAQQGGSL
jgi:hypothetical protein